MSSPGVPSIGCKHRGRKERGMKVSKETSAKHRDELFSVGADPVS